ncbi:MAG: flippase-like domain-containing protein [Bacteroidota bacterium]|nr:flippase-like domain-containing protein [Bacteroidota bacterium]
MSAPTSSSSQRVKNTVISVLKVVVPLALGVWLVIYFYDQLDEQQREDLFISFRQANWYWLLLSVVFGWFSHLSRAWRWRYLLDHLGYKVDIWNSYNATLSGYFMNMILPRAGEATRAVMLTRAEGVPFERGFGTIMAERAVDMLILLSIAAITIALQMDKLEMFRQRINSFQADQVVSTEGSSGISLWIILIAAIVILTIAFLVATRPAFKARLSSAASGFWAGLRSVFQTRHKGMFVLHTLLIWSLYIAMFWVGFFALPTTASVPFAGVMAGFIAGSVGIVLVQGGIGAYPAFVALIVSVYMSVPEGGGIIRPDALAMGWLLWAAQTIMIIVLGGVSLLLISRKRRVAVA